MQISTHSEYLYNQTWFSVLGKKRFSFSVKACSDVHVALANIPGEGTFMTYEIVLGGWGNTKSVIRDAPQVLDHKQRESASQNIHYTVTVMIHFIFPSLI